VTTRIKNEQAARGMGIRKLLLLGVKRVESIVSYDATQEDSSGTPTVEPLHTLHWTALHRIASHRTYHQEQKHALQALQSKRRREQPIHGTEWTLGVRQRSWWSSMLTEYEFYDIFCFVSFFYKIYMIYIFVTE
jgi:hypothetical protein